MELRFVVNIDKVQDVLCRMLFLRAKGSTKNNLWLFWEVTKRKRKTRQLTLHNLTQPRVLRNIVHTMYVEFYCGALLFSPFFSADLSASLHSNVSVDSRRAKCVYDARMFSDSNRNSSRKDGADGADGGGGGGGADSRTEEDYFMQMKTWHGDAVRYRIRISFPILCSVVPIVLQCNQTFALAFFFLGE